MNLIDVKGLCKAYPSFALQDVSFALKPGRIMGLIGVNGAGKTTTLKCMLNMAHPSAGEIMLLGKPFPEQETACKQALGVVFGEADYYPLKKLKSITAVTRRFYESWNEDAYRKYMQAFGLDENKQVRQLSSGMRVKYNVALALSHRARLLVLDEPTSGLDPVSRDDLLSLFHSLVKGGERGILFSTHITSDLEKCADDITYIKEGRVLASAAKESFIEQFSHLKEPNEAAPLTLEEIMLRTERSRYDL